MADVERWLATARQLYDEPRHGLAATAPAAARGGFRGGAEWMRCALGAIRGNSPHGDASFVRLGVRKYALATGAALATAAAAFVAVRLADGPRLAAAALLLPLAVAVFYATEARMVFAFPCALDADAEPLRASHRLVAADRRPTAATAAVARIATEMLCGGLLGRGFVRSWCVGCLAVLLWYEEARAAVARARLSIGAGAPA